MGSMGRLLHKATFFKTGDVADLPNTYKQTQRVRQDEETKEYVPKERIKKKKSQKKD